MITLWRIEKKKYVESFLSGEGSRLFAGRWNNKNIKTVYTSESMSLAAWEKFIHIKNVPSNTIPMSDTDLVALKISAPDNKIEVNIKNLGENWISQIYKTRDIGTEWYNSQKSLLLKIPTAILPRGINYLINCDHKLSKEIKILEVIPFKFDLRAF